MFIVHDSKIADLLGGQHSEDSLTLNVLSSMNFVVVVHGNGKNRMIITKSELSLHFTYPPMIVCSAFLVLEVMSSFLITIC